MLKNFIFAAGTLLAATLGAQAPASASVHRVNYGHRNLVKHGYMPRRARVVARGRIFSHTTRRELGRWRTARTVRWPRRSRVAAIHRGFNRTLVSRKFRVASTRRDTMIRNYVGPRSAYTPAASTGGTQVGSASYYGGRSRTASGGFVGSATCAHRSLPFGTKVLVTNLANARQAVLTVNDRGPFVRGRIVDVSTGAAGVLGMLHSGTAPVRVTVVGGPG